MEWKNKLTVFEVGQSCVIVYLRVTFFNNILSKSTLVFYLLNKLNDQEKNLKIDIEYYFFIEGSFWFIVINEKVVVILLMTELDEPFSIFDEALKQSVDKLILIRDLPLFKTESVGYDIVWSYE